MQNGKCFTSSFSFYRLSRWILLLADQQIIIFIFLEPDFKELNKKVNIFIFFRKPRWR